MTTVPSKEPVEATDEQTKPAFLRRVRIRGYKSIVFCDVSLQPLTILVGRNAAGKSNFLGALAFVRDALESNIAEATKRHGGWSSVLSRFSPDGEVSLDVEVAFSSASLNSSSSTTLSGSIANYGFVLREGPVDSPVLIREWLHCRGAEGDCSPHFDRTGVYDGSRKSVEYKWQFQHPKLQCSQIPIPRPDRLWLSSLGNQPFIDMADGLRWMGFYNFAPDTIRALQKPNPGWLLERDGRNLASVIESLNEIDADTVQRVQDYLSLIAEEVKDFHVERYGEYETVRFRLKPGVGGRTLEFDAASMSDGTLRALASLMAAFQIHLPTGPSVIGIEEPETALHPAAMRALVDALDEATQQTQMLLTTQSADLLSGRDVTPGQVLVVRNRGGQTQIQ